MNTGYLFYTDPRGYDRLTLALEEYDLDGFLEDSKDPLQPFILKSAVSLKDFEEKVLIGVHVTVNNKLIGFEDKRQILEYENYLNEIVYEISKGPITYLGSVIPNIRPNYRLPDELRLKFDRPLWEDAVSYLEPDDEEQIRTQINNRIWEDKTSQIKLEESHFTDDETLLEKIVAHR